MRACVMPAARRILREEEISDLLARTSPRRSAGSVVAMGQRNTRRDSKRHCVAPLLRYM